MKNHRLLIGVALFLTAAWAAAAWSPRMEHLEDELRPACRAFRLDAPVRVPRLWVEPGHRAHEEVTRSLRWRFLLVRRAMGRLDPLARNASCTPYEGVREMERRFDDFAAAVATATAREAWGFARHADRWSLDWEEIPLARLEGELASVGLATGALAGICRPVDLETDEDPASYVPVIPPDAAPEERPVYEDLAAQAVRLRDSAAAQAEAFKGVLEALEGRDCREVNQAFLRMILAQRSAYRAHQERQLGRLLRRRLQWKSVSEI